MKKLMKVMCVSLAISLATISCGNSGGQEDVKTTDNPAVAAGQIGTEAEPVTVNILMKDMDPNAEDVQKFTELVEKNMAKNGEYVDLVVLEAPSGKYAEVVPLAVRTGQINADLVYFQGGDIPLSNEGYFEDLTPYLASAKNINNIAEDQNLKKLESYPYLLWLSPARVSVPVIRGDVFAKLETGEALLADPNMDNYYKFLQELKQEFDMVITADGINRIDSVFDVGLGVTQTIMEDGNGGYVYKQVTEQTKEKLDLYSKLYSEGIIDPELFTNTWDVAEAKFYDGKSAILIGTAGTVIDVYNQKMTSKNGEEAELIVLPPLKGDSQGYSPVDVSKESRGWSISSSSTPEAKQAAFAFLDYMASDEGRVIDLLGLEGMHYNVVDNKISKTELASTWWPKVFETTNNFNPPYELEKPILSAPATDSLAKIEEYYSADNVVMLPDEYVASYDAMNIIYMDYLADVVKGNKDTSDFDSFVAEWNNNGGTELNQYYGTILK